MNFSLFYQYILFVHIAAGVAALVAFFIPLLSKKGAAVHRRSGMIFVNAMKGIAISGAVMAVMLFVMPLDIMTAVQLAEVAELEPQQVILQNRFNGIFLGYLSVIVYVGMVYGTQVLKVRGQRQRLSTRGYWLLWMSPAVASAALLWVGISYGKLLYQILAVIGFSNSLGYWRYLSRVSVAKNTWLLEHINAMIGGGIACFTAFAVVGGNRLFSQWLTSDGLRMLPWILPTAIGVPAILFLVRYYGKKYRIYNSPLAAEQSRV